MTAAIALPAVLAFPNASALAALPTECRRTVLECAEFDVDYGRMVLKAYEHGLDIADATNIVFSGPKTMIGGYPIAYFETPTGYLTVQPERVGIYNRVDRPAGTERAI